MEMTTLDQGTKWREKSRKIALCLEELEEIDRLLKQSTTQVQALRYPRRSTMAQWPHAWDSRLVRYPRVRSSGADCCRRNSHPHQCPRGSFASLSNLRPHSHFLLAICSEAAGVRLPPHTDVARFLRVARALFANGATPCGASCPTGTARSARTRTLILGMRGSHSTVRSHVFARSPQGGA